MDPLFQVLDNVPVGWLLMVSAGRSLDHHPVVVADTPALVHALVTFQLEKEQILFNTPDTVTDTIFICFLFHISGGIFQGWALPGFGTMKKCAFNKGTLKFCVERCCGTSVPRTAHLTVS